ncbi:unnamed protein product [Mytilus coruscus]|uniref:Uncharacterized protein n=1 Tax=Mytilus coruscus TaxID=42192 RepID=A0A6J8AUZ0_MYTCO|nr:unnamed protein product [Mytilus coruscus]
MSNLLQQLKQRTNQISLLQTEFSEMTQYATELQMYVGLGEIEETASQAANYIEDLISEDNFDEKNLDVTISSAINSILQEVKSFGDVNIKTRQSTLRLKAGRKYQAQYVVHTVPGIEEIKSYMLRILSIPKDMRDNNIYACRILPDGKYLILNKQLDQGHLLLFSNNGLFIRKVVTFTGYPYDACFFRNNTAAVTLGSEYQTALMDIQKNKITKKLNFLNSVLQ